MNLFKLKIRAIIRIIVALVISIMGVFGTYSYFSVSSLTDLGDLESQVGLFERKLEQLRNSYSLFLSKDHKLDFFENKDDESLTELRFSVEQLRELSLTVLASDDLISNSELSMYFRQAKILLSDIDRKYTHLAENIIVLGNGEIGMQADIRRMQNLAESKLYSIEDNELKELFAKVKKSCDDYVVTEQADYATNFYNSIKKVNEYLKNELKITSGNDSKQILISLTEYENSFSSYDRLTVKNGIISNTGLSSEIFSMIDELKINIVSASSIISKTKEEANRSTIIKLFVWGTIAALLIAVILLRTFQIFYNSLDQIGERTDEIKSGKLIIDDKKQFNNKIGRIFTNLNLHNSELIKKNVFINNMAEGNFDTNLEVTFESDVLGVSLNKLHYTIIEQRNAEKKDFEARQIREKNIEMLANFGDILRNYSESYSKLSFEVISNLLTFLDANIGGLYVLEGDVLKPEAAIAYGQIKELTQIFKLGEGLIGSCAYEKNSFFLENIPDDYMKITSGFGSTKPNCLFITPLLKGEEIYGVIELASLNIFTPEQVKFVENLSDDIAATLSYMRVNIEIKSKLEQMSANEKLMKDEIQKLKKSSPKSK